MSSKELDYKITELIITKLNWKYLPVIINDVIVNFVIKARK